jgi:hypothetical protein
VIPVRTEWCDLVYPLKVPIKGVTRSASLERSTSGTSSWLLKVPLLLAKGDLGGDRHLLVVVESGFYSPGAVDRMFFSKERLCT